MNRGFSGNAFVFAGDSNDTLVTGRGNDRLYGESEDDSLEGFCRHRHAARPLADPHFRQHGYGGNHRHADIRTGRKRMRPMAYSCCQRKSRAGTMATARLKSGSCAMSRIDEIRIHVCRDAVRLVMLCAAVLGFSEEPAAGQTRRPSLLPTWSAIERVAEDHFADERGHRPGDILSRSDVAGLFGELQTIGWNVTDRADILRRVLPDGDDMVQKLRSPQGRRFMRQFSRFPDGYDRLDRLRRMPYGHRRIRELIRGPDGYKLIEYMTTSHGGTNLGKQLSRARNGRDFNKPTGRPYTASDVLKRLKSNYAAERARRSRTQNPIRNAGGLDPAWSRRKETEP